MESTHGIPHRVIRRVREKYYIYKPTGCHISTYSVGGSGYAQVGWQDGPGRIVMSCHRLAWIVTHGPIPDGMTVDHLCKERRCVNVDHMRLLSNFENARRTYGRDWPLGECARGHSNEHLGPINAGAQMGCTLCYAPSPVYVGKAR